MAPGNPLRPWSHLESWSTGFSITPPRPNGPIIRGRGQQRARATTTLPIVHAHTGINAAAPSGKEYAPLDAMIPGVAGEPPSTAHRHRRHTESIITTGGRGSLVYGLASLIPTVNVLAQRNAVPGDTVNPSLAGPQVIHDVAGREHSEAITGDVDHSASGGHSVQVVPQAGDAAFRRRRSNSVCIRPDFAGGVILNDVAVEDDPLDFNEPIPLLRPVSYSPASHPLRSGKLGFRRARSQNVSEHRFGILPPTLGQIEEINRTHTSKEAKLKALQEAVNPQPFGIPGAVLELRARLAPQGNPRLVTDSKALLAGEEPSVAQVSQGLSWLDLRNHNDARALDVVAKSPEAERPQRGGNVGAFRAEADMNDGTDDPNAEVCHGFARAKPAHKVNSECSSTRSPATTGFNLPSNTARTFPDGSVDDRLDVEKHDFNSRGDASCGEDFSLHVTRTEICAPHSESLPVPSRQFPIADTSVSPMEHFARRLLVGYAMPISAFHEFNAEPIETGDGAALIHIFNTSSVAANAPNAALINAGGPTDTPGCPTERPPHLETDGAAISDSGDADRSAVLYTAQGVTSGYSLEIDCIPMVTEEGEATEGWESAPTTFSPLGYCAVVILGIADLSETVKTEEDIHPPDEPDAKINEDFKHAEGRYTAPTETGQLGDPDRVDGFNTELLRDNKDSELYGRVQAAYERPCHANPGRREHVAATTDTQSAAGAEDDILRTLAMSLGGSVEMADLLAGTLTGQLSLPALSTDDAMDATTIAHPQTTTQTNFAIPEPVHPPSANEDDLRLHNALNAFYLETTHHNAAMTSLETQAAACRRNMDNEPWSPENIAVFEERIKGYKQEAQEEVARHEKERTRLEQKIEEVREALV